VALAYRDGGWDAGAVAEAWPALAAGEQSVGIALPEGP
jgi:hypothetical protein